jgi:hypothetical protein
MIYCFSCASTPYILLFSFLTFLLYVSDRATCKLQCIHTFWQLLRDMYVLEPIADRMERSKLERKLQKQKPFFLQEETTGEND